MPDEKERNNHYAFRFRGRLIVEDAGEHTFYLASDDGSKLFINGELVVDHDGGHGFEANERSGSVELEEGLHYIEVQFFEATGGGHTTARPGRARAARARTQTEAPEGSPPATTLTALRLFDRGRAVVCPICLHKRALQGGGWRALNPKISGGWTTSISYVLLL